ncbi:MAG: polysaccharide biosynthesis/export family protein [Roseinatronobacter sp.]
MAAKLIPALLALAVLSACAAPAPQATRTEPVRLTLTPVTAESVVLASVARPGTYLVGVGDVVQIHAVEAPELTRPAGYVVEADGAIDVPYLGRVPAADRDMGAIRADLAQRLRAYFPKPQVDLRVTGFNSRFVSVVGDVAKPARLALTTQPKTVIDAINEAGGFATGSRARAVTLLRGGQELPVDMEGFLTRGAALPVLMDGDVVQVGREARGMVARTRDTIALYTPDMTREQALSFGAQAVSVAQVLGHASPGAVVAVHVLRAGMGAVQGYSFSAADARDPAIGGRFKLAPGDAVVLTDPGQPAPTDLLGAIAARL